MKISRANYISAQGLWHMAVLHQKRAVEFETELNALLGLENGSHISDGIYGMCDTLDEGLKKEKIEVENAAT